MFLTILIPTLLLGALALLFGFFLAYAAKIFFVKIDPKIEQINETLPGVNCGACGYPGCVGYAEALVNGDIDVSLCSPGGADVAKKIGIILGQDAALKERYNSVIHCSSGGYENTNFKYEYLGIKSCKAVTLLAGGLNLCDYGCVGQNDCISACKFGAISLNDAGMRIVDVSKCVGCKACVKICPRGLIEVAPISKSVHVYCSSKDKAVDAKKHCGNKTPCIGCGLCEKNCPFNAIKIENNIARIDYALCENCGLCAKKCPTKALKDTKKRGKAIIDVHNCIGCTICAKKCITKCITGELKKTHTIDTEKCIGCEICIDKCPKKAIVIDYYM